MKQNPFTEPFPRRSYVFIKGTERRSKFKFQHLCLSLKKNEQLSSSRYEKCNSSNSSFCVLKIRAVVPSNGYHLFNVAVALPNDAVYTFHKCFQIFFLLVFFLFFFFKNSDWRLLLSHPNIPLVARNSSQTIIIIEVML